MHKEYLQIKTHNGFIGKHIYAMEMHLGRKLDKGEIVHHKDENTLNNYIDNLQVMTIGEHIKHHKTGKKHSLETREKISLAKQNMSPETRAKISFSKRRENLSSETREKMSLAAKNRKTLPKQ